MSRFGIVVRVLALGRDEGVDAVEQEAGGHHAQECHRPTPARALHRLGIRCGVRVDVHEPHEQRQEQRGKACADPRVLGVLHHASKHGRGHDRAVHNPHMAEAPREAVLQLELNALLVVRRAGADERLHGIEPEVAEAPGERPQGDGNQSHHQVLPREGVVHPHRTEERDHGHRDSSLGGEGEHETTPLEEAVSGPFVGVVLQGEGTLGSLPRSPPQDDVPGERAHHPESGEEDDDDGHPHRADITEEGNAHRDNGEEEKDEHPEHGAGHVLNDVLTSIPDERRHAHHVGGGGEEAVQEVGEPVHEGWTIRTGRGHGPLRGTSPGGGGSFFGVGHVASVGVGEGEGDARSRNLRGVKLRAEVARCVPYACGDLVASHLQIFKRWRLVFVLRGRFLKGVEVALDEDHDGERDPRRKATLHLLGLQAGHEADEELCHVRHHLVCHEHEPVDLVDD